MLICDVPAGVGIPSWICGTPKSVMSDSARHVYTKTTSPLLVSQRFMNAAHERYSQQR